MADSVFSGISFVKPNRAFHAEYTGTNLAPMFRKTFRLHCVKEARLCVCGLGYAYYYINGVSVSPDLFTAPVSDYCKTLWYNVYDVTALLKEGENCLAVWCGNGWFNEEFPTSWKFHKAAWRDVPKFILRLDVNGETTVTTNDVWKCQPETAVLFNALRSGEHFDLRAYDDNWTAVDYADDGWEEAASDSTPPAGEFRACPCEPIREFEHYPAVSVRKTGGGRFVFDIGQNISGYVRLSVCGRAGQMLTIRYAEHLQENGELELDRMWIHYKQSPVQTDRLILSGKPVVWSPRFCYHGFRFIEISGLEESDEPQVEGIFVHQAVDTRTEFSCSEELLNRMFRAGQYSVWSNMFYMITDCPTREKLGWANDAQGTAEQILTNFKSEKLYTKWLTDICDAMREDGAMPGIIPTGGWGYEWGNGPVSDGILFEIPHRLYLHTGKADALRACRPYFDRYLAYLKRVADDDGYNRFGLDDWARPVEGEKESDPVPTAFINAVLTYHFCRIAEMAARLDGADTEPYEAEAAAWKEKIRRDFVRADGTCTIPRQCAVSMLIYYHLYDDLEPLKAQLRQLVEEKDFHLDCGMVGIRRLYYALNRCGLQEYAYRILTAHGFPSYRGWMEHGATTLWEYWTAPDTDDSKNHQMYSDFMSWIIKTIIGVRAQWDDPAYRTVHIEPYFFEQLDWAKGSLETDFGRLSVSWRKENGLAVLDVDIPSGMHAFWNNTELSAGKHHISVRM